MSKPVMPPNAPNGQFDAVVFDLGGVLIDWDPRYLYRSLFDGDDEAMEQFLTGVTTPEWNLRQDAGRTWREAVEELVAIHPERRNLISAYDERWAETLGGPIEETVEVLADLRRSGVRLAALSNWSAEKFPIARARHDFLSWFETIVVSGEVGMIKPDPRIFEHLLQLTGFEARRTVFIDDSKANARAAADIGMTSIRFQDADTLRAELETLRILSPKVMPPASNTADRGS